MIVDYSVSDFLDLLDGVIIYKGKEFERFENVDSMILKTYTYNRRRYRIGATIQYRNYKPHKERLTNFLCLS